MYQNYIFDFYGTLADIRTDEEAPELWRKLSELYREHGAVYKPMELKDEFRRLESEKTMRCGGKYAEPDIVKVFAYLYINKGILCSPILAWQTAVFFRSLSRKFIRCYDGVAELLSELKGRGKGIYLLSNAQAPFTRPEIEMLCLTDYFDGIFLSSEHGQKKPSPAFFRKLLQKFQLKPAECVMIGNDEETDIVGAQRSGLSSLYIHTEISPERTGKIKADYCVMDGDFRKIRTLILD